MVYWWNPHTHIAMIYWWNSSAHCRHWELSVLPKKDTKWANTLPTELPLLPDFKVSKWLKYDILLHKYPIFYSSPKLTHVNWVKSSWYVNKISSSKVKVMYKNLRMRRLSSPTINPIIV